VTVTPLDWKPGVLSLLDQRLLPGEERWVDCRDEHSVAAAIRDMLVRGAPAIGCTAAFGVALAARRGADVEAAIELLAATRPTAVNLFWALGEMRAVAAAGGDAAALEERALAIWRDDIDRCRRIGRAGAALVPDGATILTHCNAGALATGGYGTALGVVRAAVEQGKRVRVFADETRPYLQGARLTAWELAKDGIDVTVIPDVAAAWLMRRGEITLAIVGADRIAANGDFANKIGTYGVALAANEHRVPFYVAAPRSTVDLATPDGEAIPIEERSSDEVTRIGDRQIAPLGVPARHPAFDVTPARLVSAFVLEIGVVRPPYDLADQIS
jgi:methylthioribose-1-phosphate isomerase